MKSEKIFINPLEKMNYIFNTSIQKIEELRHNSFNWLQS